MSILTSKTAAVPAGGGGVFDVKIDTPGLYPFVSHAFAAVDEGQVGLLNVGDVAGTMTHYSGRRNSPRATTTALPADLDALDLVGGAGRSRVEPRGALSSTPCSISISSPGRDPAVTEQVHGERARRRAGGRILGARRCPARTCATSSAPSRREAVDAGRRTRASSWKFGRSAATSSGEPQRDVDERRPEVVPVDG